MVQTQSGQMDALPQKYLTQKRSVRVAQVVQYLPSKCKALSSNLSSKKRGELI
jgi:hypothetical protein